MSVGKSTLINALVRERVLPSAAEPLSSVPVELRYGSQLVATIHIFDGVRPIIRQFVGAQDISDHLTTRGERVLRNKYSRTARVLGAEVSVPSDLLASGLHLIDTPGVGGLNPAHRRQTLATLQNVDAVLFTILPDRPVNAYELAFLAESVDRVGSYVIVQTHRDHTSDAVDRLTSVLATLRRPDTWAGVADTPAHEIAQRFTDVQAVAVSAKLALDSSAADLCAGGSTPDLTGMGDLCDTIRQEIVDKAVKIHRADMLRLTRSTADAVRTRLDDLMELLRSGDESAKPIREREERVLKWIERDGDNWKSDLRAATTAVQAEVTETTNARIRLLRRTYRDKFATMKAAEIESKVRQLVVEPDSLVVDLLATVRSRLTDAVSGIISAHSDDRVAQNLDLIRTAEEVSGHLPASPSPDIDLSDAYASPAARVEVEDYVPVATVGITMFARQYTNRQQDSRRHVRPGQVGTASSAVAAIGAVLASSPVLVPIAIAAALFTGIAVWRRRRADTIAAAQQAYADVENAILQKALPPAVEQAAIERDALIELIEELTEEERASIARDREDLDWAANLPGAERLDLMDDIDRDRRALDRCTDMLSDVEAIWSR